MGYSSKWNTHQNGTLIHPHIINNGTLILSKMELIGIPILSKGNTHIKKEHSSKRNTHQNGILIKMEYSSKWNPHIIKRNTGEKVESM